MLRRIDAPGIQINEIDRSQYGMPDYSIVGTTCLICGFADKGENYSIHWINTIQTLVENYGYPQTEEERYFWNACAEVLNKGGICLAARLPYDNDALTTMPYVEYQILPLQQNKSDGKYGKILSLDKTLSTYIELRQSKSGYISREDYDKLVVDRSALQTDKIKIVDITNSQYQKTAVKDIDGNVLEQECLGLMPVLVSPANALFYQQVLSCETSVVAMSSTMYVGAAVAEANKSKLSIDVVSDESVDPPTVVSSYIAEANCYEATVLSDGTNGYMLTGLASISAGEAPVPLSDLNIYKEDKHLSSLFNGISSEDQLKRKDVSEQIKLMVAMSFLSTYENGEYDEHTIDIESYSVVGSMHAVGKKEFSFGADAFAKQLSTNSINDYTASREAAEMLPNITVSDGSVLDKDNLKLVGLAVFKVTADQAESSKLQFTLVESYVGSLDSKAKSSDGSTMFIDNIVNSQSSSIRMFSNLSKTKQKEVIELEDKDGKTVYKMSDEALTQHQRAAFYAVSSQSAAVLGQTQQRCIKNIAYNISILEGLNLVYDKACDKNKYYIDLVVDAGVSNIAQAYVNRRNPASYNDQQSWYSEGDDAIKSMKLNASTSSPNAWKTVLQKYDTFCKNMRGDCMFLADGHRAFALDNDEKVVRDTAPGNSISMNVLPKLKWLNGLNTSYGAGYIDWFKGVDAWSGDQMWIPPSIKAAGIYIYTDAYWNMWDAPAGMNRGKVLGVVDCAFSPNQDEAGKIYNQCWNYACNYPIDGIILEGQKTFQRQKTAFDRVNVRRLFLHLEKEVARIARYFLYEGNTAWQRQRFIDAIRPLFENAKQRNGIIDYVIKCDEDNNTAQTIDNNELRCSIAIKPVKSIEFILLNFICTNQSASVSEEVLK